MKSATMERDGGYTEEQINAANKAKRFQWNAREVPKEYDPVQLKNQDITLSCIPWWNRRSNILCCCFPFLKCFNGATYIDADDVESWRELLKNPNPDTPESMQGLWWLADNIAHENLVAIFNDTTFVGTFNKEGTDGYGTWDLSLFENWSRDQSCFGFILLSAAKVTENEVNGYMNMKDGILTVEGKEDGTQIVYRINDNEWWKVHYDANPGNDGDQNVNYMYKWVKVLDKDGNETEHWKDWIERAYAPLPNRGCCLSNDKVLENMVYQNKKQVVKVKSP